MATNEYLILTGAPFTANGSPTIVDDQHNPNATYDFDNTNDYLTSSEEPITASSGTAHSFGCWGKIASVDGMLMCQRNDAVSADGGFYLYLQGSGYIAAYLFTDGSNFLYSNGNTNLADDTWHHFLAAGDSGDMNIYVDGAEIAYGSQNLEGGSYTGIGLTVDPLAIGGFTNGTFLADGIVSRPKIWEGTQLSAAQALAEYNAEVAAIGEGFSQRVPIIDGVYSNELIPGDGVLDRDLYKSG